MRGQVQGIRHSYLSSDWVCGQTITGSRCQARVPGSKFKPMILTPIHRRHEDAQAASFSRPRWLSNQCRSQIQLAAFGNANDSSTQNLGYQLKPGKALRVRTWVAVLFLSVWALVSQWSERESTQTSQETDGQRAVVQRWSHQPV